MTAAQKRAFLLNQSEPKQTNRAVRNELLQAIFSQSNAVGLKILFYLAKQNLSVTNKELVTFSLDSDEPMKFTLDSKDVQKHINCSIYTIKSNIDSLMKTTVIFKDPESDDIEMYQLIPISKYVYGEGKIKISIFPKVFKLISEVERNFSVIDIDKLMELSNKNSIRTLMLLERINGFGTNIPKRKTYSLDELNALYGLDYKSLGAFATNVLKRSQDDLNDINSKLNLEYQMHFEPQAIGRPKAKTITIDLIQNQPTLFSQ